MALVRVVTTGVMEQRALHLSLQALFPEHEFVAHERLNGFTGAPLPPDIRELPPHSGRRLSIDKFVKTLIGLFAPGQRKDRRRPDYVLAIDDLELVNADAPENVIRAVREAVERTLRNWDLSDDRRQRLEKDLQERCSFHLMAPMTEAYFFADAQAFARATHPGPDHASGFDPIVCDVEAFSVDDPAYLDPPDHRDIGWRKENRRRHPKHYLEYLTDPAHDGKVRYDETRMGVQALASLAWPDVLCPERHPSPHRRFARSLFADLCDMLGTAQTATGLSALDRRHCEPRTWPPPPQRVLRNL